jgi:hypothetical protein
LIALSKVSAGNTSFQDQQSLALFLDMYESVVVLDFDITSQIPKEQH